MQREMQVNRRLRHTRIVAPFVTGTNRINSFLTIRKTRSAINPRVAGILLHELQFFTLGSAGNNSSAHRLRCLYLIGWNVATLALRIADDCNRHTAR